MKKWPKIKMYPYKRKIIGEDYSWNCTYCNERGTPLYDVFERVEDGKLEGVVCCAKPECKEIHNNYIIPLLYS